MAWLWLRPLQSIEGRNPWDSLLTSMNGWRFEDPCNFWYKKPNLSGTPGGGGGNFVGGPGQGAPTSLWYEQDPWTPEYRAFTNGWPPPDPDVDQPAYDAWVRTALTYEWPRQYYGSSIWASCPPYNQYPKRGFCTFMCGATAIQNIWDNNSSNYRPIGSGSNNKPRNRYRILWLRPRTAGVAGWNEVTTVNRVRIDAAIGQRQHFTGSGFSSWRSRFAFRLGYYQHNQDYPNTPSSWVPSAITWSPTIQVGSSISFNVRPYYAELTLSSPPTRDEFANRGYILVSYWPLDGVTQNTIDVHRTWFAVDAVSGPTPPGEGPETPVLSVIG